MSRTYHHRNKRDFRKGQKCPRCGDKNLKAKLEPCPCGCGSGKGKSKTGNLVCKTCWWSNF